tara:strand:- start:250 stop:516 length:267 start_codon:yes stop_codon:yes gene_type:complete
MRIAVAGLALACLTLGVIVVTREGQSAERAIERRERMKLRHFARLEAASRARVAAGRTMQKMQAAEAGRAGPIRRSESANQKNEFYVS